MSTTPDCPGGGRAHRVSVPAALPMGGADGAGEEVGLDRSTRASTRFRRTGILGGKAGGNGASLGGRAVRSAGHLGKLGGGLDATMRSRRGAPVLGGGLSAAGELDGGLDVSTRTRRGRNNGRRKRVVQLRLQEVKI